MNNLMFAAELTHIYNIEGEKESVQEIYTTEFGRNVNPQGLSQGVAMLMTHIHNMGALIKGYQFVSATLNITPEVAPEVQPQETEEVEQGSDE